MQLAERDIPAVILAGGQGRRIGGDKAQVLLGGVPLWRHVFAQVGPQVPRVAVNGEGAFDSVPRVMDEVPGLGPLGGILAAMVWAQSVGAGRVLTVAVDTPFLPLDLVARLGAMESRVVVAETVDGLHGTTAVWDVGLEAASRGALEGGTRKVTDWTQSIGFERVMFEDARAFFNVNTAEDLAMAEARL